MNGHRIPEMKEGDRAIDVRALPPPERHDIIFKIFDELKSGQTLYLINDHEPVHLLHYMRHERTDFNSDAYRAYEVDSDIWVGLFNKKTVSKPRGSKAVFTNIERERIYDDRSFTPVPVYASKDYKVLMVYLKAGQFIPVHTPKIDLILIVHSGEGEVVAGDTKREVGPGDIVIVPGGTKRGIVARTDMEAFHLVSPVPAVQDHDGVMEMIHEGRFE
ncbi:MAG TPA: DUF2249 domain-containing protein [Thermodesulfobacteriota bacterium]|nr:DUF2249 domain-containing protein [Thermodesulfobacteriota bacterium]